MQCVDQYTAQQADELNLEPTDIINVLRKTNEGEQSRGQFVSSKGPYGPLSYFKSKKKKKTTNEWRHKVLGSQAVSTASASKEHP